MLKGDLIHNRYEIVDLIGQGGMSEVFLAVDRNENRRQVALKKLLIAPDSDISALTYSFRQEFDILSEIHHPNIPRVFETFHENRDFYIAEEYIEGEEVKVPPGGILPREAVKIILQLCDVLEYLHKHNIIYRDLKPENILIDGDGKVNLVDFGISRLYNPDKDDDTIELGTPGYAPPEAYQSPQTDERSDIYCMCALLHQLLTGKDPLNNPFKFTPPSDLNKKVPKELSVLVMKGLDLSPEKRFPNIKNFREAIFSTGAFHKKFKSYQKKMGRREDFHLKEKMDSEFGKYRKTEILFTYKDVLISIIASLVPSVMVWHAFPSIRWITAVTVFLLSNGIILLSSQLGNRKFRKVQLFPSGLSYEGNDRSFACLWEDIYAVKLNLSKKYKEVTVVTLQGDFSYSENLEGWDQLMKLIQRQANLKERHDISGINAEYEVYEKM